MNKMEQLQQKLPDRQAAALVWQPHTRRYLTGFDASDGYVLVTADAGYFMTDFRYIEAARAQVRGAQCGMYERMEQTLQEQLEKHGIRRLYVEETGLDLATFHRFRSLLPETEIVTDATLERWLNELRLCKTAEEVEAIREAQRLTDEGYTYILERIEPGRTEKEVALDLEFFMRRQGADAVSFDFIVVSGANSSLPHGVPGDKKIERGDFVTMDFGALWHGWHSDMTRTVAVGSVSDEQRLVYDTVLQAQLACLKMLKSGVSCKAADAAAREVIRAAGYGPYFGHSTGHGVGVEIHEMPRLSQGAGEDRLAVGNVVTVEPGIYLEGKFGVRIEDMVLITENGIENFTKSPKNLTTL